LKFDKYYKYNLLLYRTVGLTWQDLCIDGFWNANRLIGLHGQYLWPPRSPDLTLFVF